MRFASDRSAHLTALVRTGYGYLVTIGKSPLELAALATVAVPGLNVAGLRPPQYVDELVSVTGIIDIAGNRWTVTCPHDAIGGLEFEDQDALLKRFTKAYKADMVPFRVPQPIGFARLKNGTRVIVHDDLGGRFMTEEDFSDPHILPASLARSIGQLHNLPPGIYEGIDLPSYSAAELRERHLAVLDEAATQTMIPSNLWNRWEAALDDIALWRFATVPVHGDLQSTNVTIHEGVVRTLSGFTSAHVGDPATDYAWVLAQAGERFLDRFREAYQMTRPQADIHIETRAQLISELALVRWLLHGIHADDAEVISSARNMLEDLSNDIGDAQLVEHGSTEEDIQRFMEENSHDVSQNEHPPSEHPRHPHEQVSEKARVDSVTSSNTIEAHFIEEDSIETTVLSLDEYGQVKE